MSHAWGIFMGKAAMSHPAPYEDNSEAKLATPCHICHGSGNCQACEGYGCMTCDYTGDCQACDGTGEKQAARRGRPRKKVPSIRR